MDIQTVGAVHTGDDLLPRVCSRARDAPGVDRSHIVHGEGSGGEGNPSYEPAYHDRCV
jgi:hypothetical protein